MADNRIFGEIPGYPEGSLFESRKALIDAGLHTHRMAGMSRHSPGGVDAIVLSGGYEDDEDNGSDIVYTGHGGRDPNSGQQIADQEFDRGNAALAENMVLGLPVRVIRGAELNSPFAPEIGYRYDGLYSVTEVWQATGASGHKVWRFRLSKSEATAMPPLRPGGQPPIVLPLPLRKSFTVTRILRDSAISRGIKSLYDYTCQVCGVRLETPAGPYAEGAHIKALGSPHNGPDMESNLLCLCPNHHVLFDDGAIAISNDLRVLGMPGTPPLNVRHAIELEFVRYHREHFGVLVTEN